MAETHSTAPRISSGEPRMEQTAMRSAAVEPATASVPEELRRPLLAPVKQDSVFASQHEERAESTAHRMETPAAPDLLVPFTQFIERPADSDRSSKAQVGKISQAESVETSEPLRATSLMRPASAGPVRMFARPPADQPQPMSSTRIGGDDIQIHIGRIEVIAVPQQPAARPAPAPARRGPSLEEYLQRRDRRSR